MRGDKVILRIALPILIPVLIAGYILLRNMGTGPRVDPIVADAVDSMTLRALPEGEPVECGREEIESFVMAYNRARYYRDDVGTTPLMGVEIVFANGDALKVWGGGTDFQGMARDGEQHNIRGWKLRAWFDGVLEK